MTPLQEARLLSRAVRRRWDIPQDQLGATLLRLYELRDYGESDAVKIAASRAIILCEAQNQSDEHKVVDVRIQQEHARLDAIAAELGIDKATVEHVGSEAARITGSDEEPSG